MKKHSGLISGTGMFYSAHIPNFQYTICSLTPGSYSTRSYNGLAADKPWRRGSASVNVNQWLKYFNVRSNSIDLVAGKSYIVKIKPIDHITQVGIRELSIEKRKCLYRDEKESLLTLIIYCNLI